MSPAWYRRIIYPGDSGLDVVSMQAALGVPTTGVYDEYTESYVRGVQRVANKEMDGVVDADVAEQIGERARIQAGLAPAWFEHDAELGHHCPCVLAIRQALNGLPHTGQPDFDERVADEVKRFQGNRGLDVTGVVDKETASALGEC